MKHALRLTSFNLLSFSLFNIQFVYTVKNRFCGHNRILEKWKQLDQKKSTLKG